jgi:hypothetical protein
LLRANLTEDAPVTRGRLRLKGLLDTNEIDTATQSLGNRASGLSRVAT